MMDYADHLRHALDQLRAALAHHEAERARWSQRLEEIEASLPNAERAALVRRARTGALAGEGADALYWCADRDMSAAARRWGALHREIGHLEAVLDALDAAPRRAHRVMCQAERCSNWAMHGPDGVAVACWQHAGDWPEVPESTPQTSKPAVCLWCGHVHPDAQVGPMNDPKPEALDPVLARRCAGCEACDRKLSAEH